MTCRIALDCSQGQASNDVWCVTNHAYHALSLSPCPMQQQAWGVWPYDTHIQGLDLLLQNTVIMLLGEEGKEEDGLTDAESEIGKSRWCYSAEVWETIPETKLLYLVVGRSEAWLSNSWY